VANIIITTHWTDGDVIPFLNIGKHLKRDGHEVTIFTHCFYEEKIKEAGINFVAWDTWSEYKQLLNDMSNYSDTVAGKEEIQVFRDKYESVKVKTKEYELMKPYCEKENTILLAKNRSSIAALMIAEKLKCPLIWVYMNPYEYESIANYNNLNAEKLSEEVNELRKVIGLKPIDGWLAWQYCPKVQIGLWPKWYNSDMVNIPKNIKLVGFPLEPLNKTDCSIPNRLKEILLENPAPVIISGGTSKQIRREFYTVAIKACANLKRKVIVATRYKELLPETIPENVYVFDYIPLYQVLPYASIIIHHGGIGTISNAVNAGVPQLILADYLDRPLNGSIVKKIGLGEYLPHLRWNNENIIESINKLLRPDYKEKCVKFAKEHKESNSFKNIREIVKSAHENQQYLIDYETIKNCAMENNLESNTKEQEDKKSNRSLLSRDLKKYLLEKKRSTK
jgi:UDP:flavonoid glycosyltransferase YjiC (YdhE family)